MFIQEEIQPRKEQEEEEEDSVIMYRFSIHYATRWYVGVFAASSQSNKNHVRMRDEYRAPPKYISS